MVFSWKAAKANAIEIKVRRAITMADSGQNSDFKIQHPDWVRDAQAKNYTHLKKVVKESVERYQAQAQARRDKRARKN